MTRARTGFVRTMQLKLDGFQPNKPCFLFGGRRATRMNVACCRTNCFRNFGIKAEPKRGPSYTGADKWLQSCVRTWAYLMTCATPRRPEHAHTWAAVRAAGAAPPPASARARARPSDSYRGRWRTHKAERWGSYSLARRLR